LALACNTSSAGDSVSMKPWGWIPPGVRMGSLAQLEMSSWSGDAWVMGRWGNAQVSRAILYRESLFSRHDVSICPPFDTPLK
jgi:hypothetical protein